MGLAEINESKRKQSFAYFFQVLVQCPVTQQAGKSLVESDIESRQALRVAVWIRLHSLPCLSQGGDCWGAKLFFRDSLNCVQLESKPDFVEFLNFALV